MLKPSLVSGSFAISAQPVEAARHGFCHEHAGAVAVFEGRVRSLNEGRPVAALEYEAYQAMAEAEGRRILQEAAGHFAIIHAGAVHRIGRLGIGDVALFVMTASMHRKSAFAALCFIVDEIKARVPIWKKEHYVDGAAQWVACHHCGPDAAGRGHAHG